MGAGYSDGDEQLKDNLAALELQLAPEDIGELDRVSAPRFNFPTAFLANATAQSYAGLTVNGVKFGPSPR